MTSDERFPILCGVCHVSPKEGFERDGETWARCTICGQEVRVEDIAREAGEHYATKVIGGMLRDVAVFSTKSGSQRKYRWITRV